MFCGNCGTENEKNARFCKNCGQTLGTRANQELEKTGGGDASNVDVKKADIKKITNILRVIPKKVFIGAGVAVLAIITIICIVTRANDTIDLNKYITIESEGYNGYGYTYVEIDWDAIEQKYGSKLKFNSAAKTEYGGFLNMMTPLDIVQDYVDIELDENEELTNGDIIKYTWDVDEDLFEFVKCKLKYKDSEYEVSGLTEIQSFDAFGELSVEFEGVSPNGYISIDYSGSDMSYYDFICNKKSGLKNGDVVTITINENKIEYMAQNFGKVPAKKEKAYTVSGLDEHVDSYADLSEEFISLVKSETEDVIYSNVARNYDQASKVNDLKYVGYVMNHIKDDSFYWGAYNNLYIIYSGVVSSVEDKFPPTTVYYPVKFSDILSSRNEITYDSKSDVVGSSYIANSWRYSTSGYTNPLLCYLDIAESDRDSYVVEVGDGLKKYEEYKLVTSLADIEDSYRESIQKAAKATIEAYIADNYNGGSVASELSYVGEILLDKKEDTSIENKNLYAVVLKATVSNENGRFEPTEVYFPVIYNGIVRLPDKEYIVCETSGIKGSSYLPNSYYSTKGYIDGNDLYSDLVTSNRDNYRYEVSSGLQQFGN